MISLVALLLGRLDMNTEQALKHYNDIAKKIFGNDNRKRFFQDGAFKATVLENEVKRVIKSVEGYNGEERMMPDEVGNMTKFVCAIPPDNMAVPRRFRTYRVARNESTNCMIWEAARATTAAPTFFKAMEIPGVGGIRERFCDAGLRCNNPSWEVLNEAKEIFGVGRKIGLMLSIGTGHPGTIHHSKPNKVEKVIPLKLIDALRAIATDCENVSRDFSDRFRFQSGTYYRLNVTHGAQGISLNEWDKIPEIITHTRSYLQDTRISQDVDVIVKCLAGEYARSQYVTLGGSTVPFGAEQTSL
ncbi:hypothetical protein M422DRAFT_161231 [Sphaerobolus stellatus SS14]|nr:hypothetical protein M422DRAFT_161231 [Sphaerobolus stellatus SS14]